MDPTLSGRIEALAHALSFVIGGKLAGLSARERAEFLDALRYPFEPAAEHELAQRSGPAQARRQAMLGLLDDLADRADSLAPPPADDPTAR